MPLRKFFAARGANHPAAYSILTLAVGMIVCMAIAVTISVQASNRALRAEQERERVADERARQATCLVVKRITDAYAEEPPATDAGQNVAEAWRGLATAFECSKG